MQSLTTDSLVRWRASSSLLTRRGTDPAAAVSNLLGLQAQDIAAFPLSVRARCEGCRASDLVHALDSSQHSPPQLVRTWAMRGTLHLVAADDARWLTELLGPRLRAATAGRRRALGIPDERCEFALPLLEEVLAQGPLVRADIVGGLHDRGFEIAAGSQAVPHLLGYAASAGLRRIGGPGLLRTRRDVRAR